MKKAFPACFTSSRVHREDILAAELLKRKSDMDRDPGQLVELSTMSDYNKQAKKKFFNYSCTLCCVALITWAKLFPVTQETFHTFSHLFIII